jgi:hypothetical protein
MGIDQCQIIQLPKVPEPRGNLSFIEGGRHVPFEIKRVYYLYDVPEGASRGGHAHRLCDGAQYAVGGARQPVVRNYGSPEKEKLSVLARVAELVAGKQLIGYGATVAAAQTICTSQITLSHIVDDRAELQGKRLNGVPIGSPAMLSSLDPASTYIVVFVYKPSSVLKIAAKLAGMGYRYLNNWVDCSFLHFESMSARLHQLFAIEADRSLFLKAHALSLRNSIENLSSIAGTWMYLELLNEVVPEGSVAELGVYKGGNALIALSLRAQSCPYHLFDSFTGLTQFSSSDPPSRQGELADVSLDLVRSTFKDFPNVELHEGFFSETLPDVAGEKFAMAYVDCDLYEPTMECCRFFYDRIEPGGILLFHDYSEPLIDLPVGVPFTGVKRAVDEFFQDRCEKPVVFAETTHALVVKR